MNSIEKQAFHPALHLLDVVKDNRKPEHEVNPLFLNRWSPRAYSDQKVSDAVLNQILEAARWAPSSNNQQPWRFYVANTGAKLDVFRQFILPFNRSWMDHVPQLILLGSAKLTPKGDSNGAHAFDAGSAWSHIALQATLLGLNSHAIGGFDSAKARELLNVPDDIDLHAVIIIGYPGDKSLLSEALQEREKPNQRNPLANSIIEWNA
jgi:nitroreductase